MIFVLKRFAIFDPSVLPTKRRCLASVAFALLCLALLPAAATAEEQKAESTVMMLDAKTMAFFENKIRPLLANNCYECHGEDEQESELRVDSLAGLLEGGEGYGAAIVPGDPEKSILIDAVNYGEMQMPPENKLSKQEVDDLSAWVKMGAPWPGADSAAIGHSRRETMEVTDEDRQWWSFRPLTRPAVPSEGLATDASSPIDAFIRAQLEQEGLEPSPIADRRTLVRRVTYDLTGLPPTPDEVRAFLADDASDAYERLIDRLLASPRYGERWGRHWLDIVRFTQTNGYERDDEKPYAWRYRDYVIRSFNDDKPFDQFIREQIAGDELDEVTDDGVIATGFFRLGVWDDEPDDIEQAFYDSVDDMLSTTSSAFMGLTIGCARCHAHKFDPIPHEDYYRLAAFIRNVKYYAKPDSEQRDRIMRPLPSGGEALGVTEYSTNARPTHVLLRGRAQTPGDEVQPRVPQVLVASAEETTLEIPEMREGLVSSGRRSALANWIASPKHPLTARVLANRIWQHHFGKGIVATPNDFGKTGIPPTHPELLDWLASELIDGDWHIKPLHKAIMLSDTYRQSSLTVSDVATMKNPSNTMLWRQNIRRLEAEAVRDAMLAASGSLKHELGGRGFFPKLPAQVIGSQSMPGRGWYKSEDTARNRRSVYIYSKRSLQMPLMEVFDVANTNSSTALRSQTTVAPQALALLNGRFVAQQSAKFAERLVKEATGDVEEQIRQAYWLTVSRDPTDREVEIATAYLQRQTSYFSRAEQKSSIQPTLPSALHKTFHAITEGDDYLEGLDENWTALRGDWPERGDGIRWVDTRRGPALLANDSDFDDGVIRVQLRPHPNAELAAVAFRATVQEDVFHGYELFLDPRNSRVLLNRLAEDVTPLASANVQLVAGVWQTLRIEAKGDRIRVWLDDSADSPIDTAPLIDIVDAEPLLEAGKVGLRTWGGSLDFREFVVESKAADPSRIELRGPAPAEPQQRALIALCKLIYSLNEFVYID